MEILCTGPPSEHLKVISILVFCPLDMMCSRAPCRRGFRLKKRGAQILEILRTMTVEGTQYHGSEQYAKTKLDAYDPGLCEDHATIRAMFDPHPTFETDHKTCSMFD